MYLVADIGGTHLKYGLLTEGGEIKTSFKVTTPKDSYEALLSELGAKIKDYQEQIKGVAISCPGKIDIETGIIYNGGSLPYLHLKNLKQDLSLAYNLPVSIENDGKSAALAELWMGGLRNCKNGIALVLGSGVGGGIIVNGSLYHGHNLLAGEFSFITTESSKSEDKDQLFGFQCSAVKMIQAIAKEYQLIDESNGKEVFKLIISGNLKATKIFDQYCKNIAIQVINLQYILDPEIIVIGGGISSQTILIERITKAVDEIIQALPFHIGRPTIQACRFRSNSNLLGALYHHLSSRKITVI